MTARQYKRSLKWDRRVKPAYHSGVMDGFDAFFEGRECPEPLQSPYELGFYFRRTMRLAQEVTNATIARSRGRYDGWHLAAKEATDFVNEDWIERQVEEGVAQIETYLRQAA